MDNKSVAIITDSLNSGQYVSLFGSGYMSMYSVEEAIFKYKSWKFELIILDCEFEIVNELNIIKELKSIFPDIPVIFVTNNCSAENVCQIYRAGARELYFKPFDPSDLLQKVNGLIELRREMLQGRQNALISSVSIKSENNDIKLKPVLPERLQRVLAHIEKHYDNELYLEHLANKACLSKFHFCRMFKLHLGMTPMKFISQLRIEHAKRLIEENVDNLSKVAYRVGFNDVGDFIKQFKKTIGFTPSRYRSLIKEDSEG